MLKILLITVAIVLSQGSFFIVYQSMIRAGRPQLIQHGGSSFSASVPGVSTRQLIRQRGLSCGWSDTVAMRKALDILWAADSIMLIGLEENLDGSFTADIYIDGEAFDSLMINSTECEGE